MSLNFRFLFNLPEFSFQLSIKFLNRLLISDLGEYNCNRIIVREQNLSNDFFDLKTRLAGDILQKFSNYRVKLAIVGDFSKYKNSKSFKDFVRESNKGNLIFFVDNFESAISNLKTK